MCLHTCITDLVSHITQLHTAYGITAISCNLEYARLYLSTWFGISIKQSIYYTSALTSDSIPEASLISVQIETKDCSSITPSQQYGIIGLKIDP